MTSSSSGSSTVRPLLLVAEDDPDIQRVIRLTLRRDFDVQIVDDGETLLQRAVVALPAGILLDWMLPGIDGLEVCRRLKASPVTAAIPIILLTARSQESDQQLGEAHGIAAYFTKPFDALTLRQRVHDVLTEGRP